MGRLWQKPWKLEQMEPGGLEEGVWVWHVFWNSGEGKDWLLGSTEVNRRIQEDFESMVWIVVPVTQKESTGQKQVWGRR